MPLVPLEAPPGGVLSVSALTEAIRSRLEGDFRFVRVRGEVSNYKLHGPSGHRYFTLKDGGAQLKAALYRNRERYILGELADGATVVVTGSIGVYPPRGEYQLIAQTVEAEGAGALLLELERRKARLAAEGLFDPSRKRPLPPCPRRVGVVTSPEGAALRDVVKTLSSRWPAAKIVLSPCRVQGEGAEGEIAAALALLAEGGSVDVAIVARGGGSVEDLWPFNGEAVVRAVAAFPVPVVSGVGHETDTTLTDHAADLRAATPTAAAQAVVPDREEAWRRIRALGERAGRSLRGRLALLAARADGLRASLPAPALLLARKRHAAAQAELRMQERLAALVAARRRDLSALAERLAPLSPRERLHALRRDAEALRERAARRVLALLPEKGGSARELSAKLAALDPLAVLSRGYAVVFHGRTGKAVRSPAEALPGDPLRIRTAGGEFPARRDEG